MRKGQAPFIWTEFRQAELRRLIIAGHTSQQIAAALGTSRYSVENAKKAHGLQNTTIAELETLVRPVAQYTPPDGPTLAEVYAPESSGDEPDEAFLARVLGGAQRSIEKAEAQRYARIRIASREPVTLTLWSDAHVLLPIADSVPGMVLNYDWQEEFADGGKAKPAKPLGF